MDVQHCTKPCPNDIITINENNNNDYTLKTPIHTSKKCLLPFHEYLFPRKSKGLQFTKRLENQEVAYSVYHQFISLNVIHCNY